MSGAGRKVGRSVGSLTAGRTSEPRRRRMDRDDLFSLVLVCACACSCFALRACVRVGGTLPFPRRWRICSDRVACGVGRRCHHGEMPCAIAPFHGLSSRHVASRHVTSRGVTSPLVASRLSTCGAPHQTVHAPRTVDRAVRRAAHRRGLVRRRPHTVPLRMPDQVSEAAQRDAHFAMQHEPFVRIRIVERDEKCFRGRMSSRVRGAW